MIKPLGLLLMALLSILPLQTNADLGIIQPLSFGRVAVVSNNSVENVTIDELDNISVSSGLRIITPGHRAIFGGIDYPANAQLFISAFISRSVTSSSVYSPEQFTLTTLYTPTSVYTGSDGSLEIPVGGRIQTSGNGSTNFVNTTYTATLSITINY